MIDSGPNLGPMTHLGCINSPQLEFNRLRMESSSIKDQLYHLLISQSILPGSFCLCLLSKILLLSSFTFPTFQLSFQVISTWGVRNNIDFLSLSYTRHAEDVRHVSASHDGYSRQTCFPLNIMCSRYCNSVSGFICFFGYYLGSNANLFLYQLPYFYLIFFFNSIFLFNLECFVSDTGS